MEILVCVKRVPGTGSEIPITEDGLNIDTRFLGYTIGPHEECAVEEAIRITAAVGGSVTVLTVGPEAAIEQLYYGISMGAHRGVLVDSGFDDADPQFTAAGIAMAMRELHDDGQSFDLVMFGNESADAGNYQIGVRLACAMGLPMVGGIKGIEVTEEAGTIRLSRDAGSGVEVYESDLPAAVAVKEGLNLPRYPSVRGRLKAKKAPIRTINWEGERGGLRKVRNRPRPESRADTVLLGQGSQAAGAVVDVFEDLGVV